jgi:signal transduction histidine kinase
MIPDFANHWRRLTLARQFALAGAAVLLLGMLVLGFWVTSQIEASVTRNTAVATALYVDSVIAPLLPDIRDQKILTAGARRALDETLRQGSLGDRILSFKVWLQGGLVAYSSDPDLIGRRFEPTEALQEAWEGNVTAEFDKLEDEESSRERAEGVPLLEVYSPIREPWSGRVVAVAEFYETASELEANLAAARLRSWVVVAIVTLGMLALLFGIVRRGSRMIDSQREALEGRVADLSLLLSQNEELRHRVQDASARGVALNERFLKRVSADLHDGPVQLLAVASLRLGNPGAEIEAVRGYLDDALREIRDICRGLTLPEIERLSLPELLTAATEAHERRTGTAVLLQLPVALPALSQSEKICIFRFVQEGLNNAFRHARGLGQRVSAAVSAAAVTVVVADQGGGFDADSVSGDGLGLAGLRERVESLGGTFEIDSSPAGTVLTMTLQQPIDKSR